MSDVLNEMFDYKRLSKEFLITDFIILSCEQIYVLFKKTLICEHDIFNKRVDPLGVYPTLLYNDFTCSYLPKRGMNIKIISLL